MEHTQEKVVGIVQKMYNKKQSKGRKLKPKNKLTLIKLIMDQLATKSITTIGLFSQLPPDIVRKIHDKKDYKTLTQDEYACIADLILSASKKKSNSYISHVTPNGMEILETVKNGNIKNFKVRSVFNTQERQLLLG